MLTRDVRPDIGDASFRRLVDLGSEVLVPLDYVTAGGPGSATATIANGASLSGAVDLGAGNRLAAIYMPATWTAGGLTFQVSYDGVTFAELQDDTGATISLAVTASVMRRLVLAEWLAFRHLKIRSGTSGTPVNQGGDRVLVLATVPV